MHHNFQLKVVCIQYTKFNILLSLFLSPSFPLSLSLSLSLLPSLSVSLPPSPTLLLSLSFSLSLSLPSLSSAWKNGWQVISPKKSFAVFAATPTEKAEWMAHINKCIVDLLAKSKHFHIWHGHTYH